MLEILVLGVSLGGVSLFIEACFRPGMIFSKYGDWVYSGEEFWKKPLGACLVCMNFWVTAILTAMYVGVEFIPLAVGFSHMTISIFESLNMN